jgi:CRP-like cAMP-binding protein
MLEGHSFAGCLETHFDFEGRNRPVTAEHTPRQNQLLAALPVDDYERLLPDLDPVPLPPGWTVHGAGERRDYLYFITAGIVSRFYVMENGASAELAITGNEGVVGVASVLGGESSLSQSVVVSAGHAYRVRTDLLKNELEHDGPLLRLLLRYTQALIAQAGQIAVCNRHHPLKQHLCRWILSCLDRLPSNELAVTHELMAQMLGVRREGVSEAVGKLQRAGLISHHRGQIAVLDRALLEAQACECYAVVKREYERLLCPENTMGNFGMHGTRRHYRAEWSQVRC